MINMLLCIGGKCKVNNPISNTVTIFFGDIQKMSKHLKNTTSSKKRFIGYWIVPIGLTQHPKHPSLGPTSIPIPTPASEHGSLAEDFARLEVDAVEIQVQLLQAVSVA